MRRLLITTLAVTGLLALSPASQAQIIGFDQPGEPGGTISWTGLKDAPVIGTGISFATVSYDGNVYDCSNCLMSFTSGLANGPLDGGIATFGAGGTIEVVGGVPAAGVADGTTLVSGTFTGGAVLDQGNGFFSFQGTGPDEKDADLLAFLGVDAEDFTFSTTDIGFACVAGVCEVVNADLDNTAVPVPEPPVVGLLGLGLLGVYWQSRKRARG